MLVIWNIREGQELSFWHEVIPNPKKGPSPTVNSLRRRTHAPSPGDSSLEPLQCYRALRAMRWA